MNMHRLVRRGSPPLGRERSGEPGSLPTMNRPWRRVAAGGAAAAATAAMIAAPLATSAGAVTPVPQISTVASYNGSSVISPGNPKPVSSAALSASYVADDPALGDQVVASAQTGDVYLIVGGSSESATDFGLGASGSLSQGYAYQVAGDGTTEVVGYPGHAGDGGSASAVATSNPVIATSVAFDANGNIILAGAGEQQNDTATSVVQVVARTTGTFYGVSMTAGDLYTIADVGTLGAPSTAIGMGSIINGGYGVTTDSLGDIFVGASYGLDMLNFSGATLTRYGKTMANHTSTLVAGSAVGTAACTDGAQAGVPAGGGSSVFFNNTSAVVDPSGNVYLTDNEGGPDYGCVWALPAQTGTLNGQSVTAGDAYKVAGNGGDTATSSGINALDANVGTTSALALDPMGNLLLGEDGGSGTGVTPQIQVLAHSTGTFYGVSMTAGDLYTIAGGPSATSTAAGNASAFELGGPTSLAADGSGNLYVTDEAANGTDAAQGSLYQITDLPYVTISWKTPKAVDYGTAVSDTQEDATLRYGRTAVAATIDYSVPEGTVLPGGTDPITATYAFSGAAAESDTVDLTVKAVKPTLTWAAPAAIAYGTALSATQLDAVATYDGSPIAGTFSYSSPAGTVPNVGKLGMRATFTPADGDATDFVSGGAVKQDLIVVQAASSTTLSFTSPVTYKVNEESADFAFSTSSTNGITPEGTVTVAAGATTLCKATLTDGSGTCTLSSNAKLAPKTYTVTATFSDGTKGGFTESSDSGSLVVNPES